MLDTGARSGGVAASSVALEHVLNQLAAEAIHKSDKGRKFERLVRGYLLTDPMYAQKYNDVWLWHDWPERGTQVDTGIDLVAQERDTGHYIAIQCKFHQPGYLLQKNDIDSFFTASGKHPFKGRLVVSTSDRWSKHAEDALADQQIPVTRLRIQDLATSPIDWSQFTLQKPDQMELLPKKQLRPHQVEAHAKVVQGLQTADRGKLIMACGTGKTFTSLKIAESMVGAGGNVLFLVPSLSLLSQTLGEWTGDSHVPLRSFAVCSDTKIGRSRDDEDLKVYDLAFPSTTDPWKLHDQLCRPDRERMTVVFSTYQSIDVVRQAQAMGDVPAFDLVIADEAHRTTGAMLQGEEQSHFTKVHDQRIIKAKKRLYMTATPRLYSDEQVARAVDKEAVLWSMDDTDYYGEELHRLNFGESVSKGLLSDYKVMILAVDEKYISKAVQRLLADEDNELTLDDAVKIVGCWNGLAKRTSTHDDEDTPANTQPMKRAVAFAGNIKASKKIAEMFTNIVDVYTEETGEDEDLLNCEAEHVDGTFNVLLRNHRLDWLKAPTPDNTCRILTNARCLSEGVDVPSLDAVMFLQPRDSEIDIVQAVGRVMRKAPGKEYGYVILPIGVPAGLSPEQALSDNKKYRVVWQVLQALRAHDERFDSTINKLELNKKKPGQIDVIGVGGDSQDRDSDSTEVQDTLAFSMENIGEWRDAIYARIVDKVGTRKYWESWAKDVADIAERHVTRIESILEAGDPTHLDTFEKFLQGLQRNLNPSIGRADAIEMLSQHLITKPVFEALFDSYSFVQQNPVSIAMQKMVDALDGQALEKETQTLDKFYESVRLRASGIDNAEGKQRIVIELYDKFFRTAFPRMAERLGIVYTPIEVVDYILKSANHALKSEFGKTLSDEGVHILDPFTGTGTFLVRLIQSGLIKLEDLPRKYQHELHANEIVLLAYYIAAINIEEAYHEQTGWQYEPFEGIVLTDTFQLTEDPAKGQTMTIGKVLPENSERAAKQKSLPITVIVGNPPYSAKQESANDTNQNLAYPLLDSRIESTYAGQSTAANKNSLYDSYIRGIRWASDRIGEKGIVCFVTNGGFIDGNAADGLRKTLIDEFSSLYVFNLRGNQRTSGETSRREGGKIFDSGSRATIAISLLVKNPAKDTPGKLHYHDIGDYLSREEKLQTIQEQGSIAETPWQSVAPNERHDWINQRGDKFQDFAPLNDAPNAVFRVRSRGVETSRDPWVYNSNKSKLEQNVRRMIDFYNTQLRQHSAAITAERTIADKLKRANDLIDTDPTKIKWTSGLIADLARGRRAAFSGSNVGVGLYRPFFKAWVYYDPQLNHRYKEQFYPTAHHTNIAIVTPGNGGSKGFSAFLTNVLPDLNSNEAGAQCFPLYYYEEAGSHQDSAFQETIVQDGYVRHDTITEATLDTYRSFYGATTITKEDIFYYVYGVLHSPEYRERFEADLKKELPRIPYAKDFHAFAQAGRELGELHVNYESAQKYPVTVSNTHSSPSSREALRVTKMRYSKKDDKSQLKFNSHITISDIPDAVHEYQVNGKSALEWIIDRYQVTTDKKSGIKNDPNEWSEDPSYILDLVQRIITVSVETVRIVRSLPPLEERTELLPAD